MPRRATPRACSIRSVAVSIRGDVRVYSRGDASMIVEACRWLRRRSRIASALAMIILFRAWPLAQAPAVRDAAPPGQSLFTARCGFCHGRDAAGGESGPDLTSSPLVAHDVGGGKVSAATRGWAGATAMR